MCQSFSKRKKSNTGVIQERRNHDEFAVVVSNKNFIMSQTEQNEMTSTM